MTNSNRKGKTGELDLVNFLKSLGIEARRGQQYEGGSDSPDVLAGGALENIHIECKRCEAGNPYKWLEQAKSDAGTKTPIVAHRKNGKDWIVIIELEKFIKLISVRF